MKKLILAGCAVAMTLNFGVARPAAASIPTPALTVDGRGVTCPVSAEDGTTYVSLRAVTEAMYPTAQVSWEGGQAVVRLNGKTITARPGDCYIEGGGRAIYLPHGVQVSGGRVMVPVRALTELLGGWVDWNGATGTVSVWGGAGIESASYDADELYWLSRIISAESAGEPLEGKIAVGNVVLNRVASADFPDTIYTVIFDSRYGGQFEPVRNGTIYNEPTAESVLAAKLVLEGANTAGKSLYFLAPHLTSNHWTMENRPYVTTIGCHWFYA